MSEHADMTFEEAIHELEKIVEKLEEGNVPLEKAIDYYQEGMKLSKLCNDKLTNVHKKIVQIMGEDGEITPFDLQEEV